MKAIFKDLFRVGLAATASMSVLTVALMFSQNALAQGTYTPNVNDDPTNFPPEAKFIVKTNVGMGQIAEGIIGTEFFFDARTSRDPEKTALLYRWDFNGDGNYDTGFLTEPTISKVFWDMGTFDVKLAVKDGSGQFDHTVKTIKIVRNTKPTAFFTMDPDKGSPAQIFRFNANESFDDQYKSQRLQYRWDFNGDKVYDTDWSSRTFASYTYGYGVKGMQKITLQVKDPNNERSEFTRNLEILENTIPVAVLDIEPKIGTFDTMFRFSGEKSFDDETEFNSLEFRWDTDYNGPDDIIYDSGFARIGYRKFLKFNHPDQRTGTQKIRMDVRDKDGRIGTAIAYIELHWASPYLKMLNDAGIIATRYDNDFNPDKPVSRGEVIKMILKKLGVNVFTIRYEPRFSDVGSSNPNYKYILEAEELGIVEGYPDGSFHPDSSISRSETLAMILRAFNVHILRGGFQFYPDVPKSEWFFQYVDTGTVNELVSGYDTGYFGPHDPITFGEISKMLYQVGELNKTN
ncbi:MAG: S-layer homology domain-containing protein [Candidatus Peregrinibacteria bacterium]|nr:S-layer homology domain-containing protein [Candidatus Peregrinibacteria bacterium]MDZ4244465.1 S-layer homology domain-containing protein [Candidatus Gracilibacteria bacterium]